MILILKVNLFISLANILPPGISLSVKTVLTVFYCLLDDALRIFSVGMFRHRAVPTCNDITSKANCIILSVSILALYWLTWVPVNQPEQSVLMSPLRENKQQWKSSAFFQFNLEKKKKKRRGTAFSLQYPWYITSSHCLPCARVYEPPKLFSICCVELSFSNLLKGLYQQ